MISSRYDSFKGIDIWKVCSINLKIKAETSNNESAGGDSTDDESMEMALSKNSGRRNHGDGIRTEHVPIVNPCICTLAQ
jgi:hypothetical protein